MLQAHRSRSVGWAGGDECLKTKAPSGAGGALGGAMSLPSTRARPGCPTGPPVLYHALDDVAGHGVSLHDWFMLHQWLLATDVEYGCCNWYPTPRHACE